MGSVSFYMYIASGYDMMKYRIGYVHKMLIHVEKKWNDDRAKTINTVNIDSTGLAVNLFMMTEMLINLTNSNGTLWVKI